MFKALHPKNAPRCCNSLTFKQRVVTYGSWRNWPVTQSPTVDCGATFTLTVVVLRVTQAVSTVIVTWLTARSEKLVTAMTWTSSRHVVPSAPPSVTRTHLPTASSATRRPGVIPHSWSRTTVTHRPIHAARHALPTALVQPVRHSLTSCHQSQPFVSQT